MTERFQIKKGLVGGYKISYDCPRCSTALKSPLDDAGKHDTCPQCGGQLVVPGATERERIRSSEAYIAEVKRKENEARLREQQEERRRQQAERLQEQQDEIRRQQAERAFREAEAAKSDAAASTEIRPCPYCGEEILRVAKKCKHCGEFLDEDLRQQSAGTKPVSWLTALENDIKARRSQYDKSIGAKVGKGPAIRYLGIVVLIILLATIVVLDSDSNSGQSSPQRSSVRNMTTLETTEESSQRPSEDSAAAPAIIEDREVTAESPLPFDIVEQNRVKKGGSLDPLLAPRYILLDVNAVLNEVPSEVSERDVKATLRAVLNEVRSGARRRGEQIDGVSAFLYQSPDHITGGSSALGRAEWWPQGHSFSAENVANINNKATYVEEIRVFFLPKPAETVVHRLSENQRRAIFAELVRAEDRAMREAAAQYPTDASKIPISELRTYDFKTAMEENMRVEKRLRVEYERGLLQRRGITEQELNDIKKEAMSEQWPLPPQ